MDKALGLGIGEHMKYTLKFFGIPVVSFESEADESAVYLSNVGGQYEICTEDPESLEEEWEYEEDSLGFKA